MPIPAVTDDISSIVSSVSSSVPGSDEVNCASKATASTTRDREGVAVSTKVLALDTSEDGGLNTTFSLLCFVLVVILISSAVVIMVLGLCLGRRTQELKRLKQRLAENDSGKQTAESSEEGRHVPDDRSASASQSTTGSILPGPLKSTVTAARHNDTSSTNDTARTCTQSCPLPSALSDRPSRAFLWLRHAPVSALSC